MSRVPRPTGSATQERSKSVWLNDFGERDADVSIGEAHAFEIRMVLHKKRVRSIVKRFRFSIKPSKARDRAP